MTIPKQRHEETAQETLERERVTQWTDELLRTSPMVRFMVKHLTLLSCSPTQPGSIVIAPCPTDAIVGGFQPSPASAPTSASSLLLCSNNLFSKAHVERTLAHELVHWYDHCRFRVRWDHLAHHACSEVRAAALSGDCSLLREWGRRQYGLRGQFQKCVRRRAVASLVGSPACEGDVRKAEDAVDGVWKACFGDTRPFDEIY